MTYINRSLLAILLIMTMSFAYVTIEDIEIHKLSFVNKITTITMDAPKLHGISKVVLKPDESCVEADQMDDYCKHVKVILTPISVKNVPGTKYKVTEITFKNFDGDVDLIFRVPKDWLDDEDLTSKDIVIYYKDDDGWEAVDTKKLSAYEDNEYFKLEIGDEDDGYYAISTEEPEPEVDEDEDETEEDDTNPATGMVTQTDWSGWLIGVVIALLLLAVIGFGYYFIESRKFRSSI